MADIRSGMSISAVSVMLDIPVPTIRSWELRYGVPTPARTGGKHRRYSMAEILELRTLRDEIAKGSRAADAARKIKNLALAEQPGGDLVAAILEAALSFDSETVRAVLDDAHDRLGVEQVVQHVALPVLRDIGTLWEAGKCDVANEHLASQEIRSWMNAKLARARAKTTRGPLILATGPKDQHTLGLEGFYLILTHRGWSCRVLGGQTPTESLVKIVEDTKPLAIILSSHMNSSRRDAAASIRAVAHLAPTFYAGNAFGSLKNRDGLAATYLAEDLPAAADRLEAALAS
jgi:methanogenic corrinoid protein MtbC1